MLGGIRKHSTPEPVIDYLIRPKGKRGKVTAQSESRAELLGGTLLEVTPADIKEALANLCRQRPDVLKPITHIWVSCPDGTALDAQSWLALSQEIADDFDLAAWVCYRHCDTAHDHIHLVGSRVDWGHRVARDRLRDWGCL